MSKNENCAICRDLGNECEHCRLHLKINTADPVAVREYYDGCTHMEFSPPPFKIAFYRDGVILGSLTETDDNKLAFVGNADESAKVFWECISNQWPLSQRLEALQAQQEPVTTSDNRLMSMPAEQHQGDPVAWRYQTHPGGLWYLSSSEYNARLYENTGEGSKVEPLYTHADHGEVERLRTAVELAESEALSAIVERDDLREQLAERDALLRKIVDARSENEMLKAVDEAEAFLRTTQRSTEETGRSDLVHRGPPAATTESLVHYGQPAAVMPASAEPSAPTYPQVRMVRAHKHTCALVQPGSSAGAICDCRAVIDGHSVEVLPNDPAERDEREAFERVFVVQEGVYFSPERKEYRSMNGRTIEETDSIDLNLRLSGWMAHAALSGFKPTVLSKCVLCDQLQADITERDELIDQLRSGYVFETGPYQVEMSEDQWHAALGVFENYNMGDDKHLVFLEEQGRGLISEILIEIGVARAPDADEVAE